MARVPICYHQAYMHDYELYAAISCPPRSSGGRRLAYGSPACELCVLIVSRSMIIMDERPLKTNLKLLAPIRGVLTTKTPLYCPIALYGLMCQGSEPIEALGSLFSARLNLSQLSNCVLLKKHGLIHTVGPVGLISVDHQLLYLDLMSLLST